MNKNVPARGSDDQQLPLVCIEPSICQKLSLLFFVNKFLLAGGKALLHQHLLLRGPATLPSLTSRLRALFQRFFLLLLFLPLLSFQGNTAELSSVTSDALVSGSVALVVEATDHNVALGLAPDGAGAIAYGAVMDLGASVSWVGVMIALRTHS